MTQTIVTAHAINSSHEGAAATLRHHDQRTRIVGDDLEHTRSLIIAHVRQLAHDSAEAVILNSTDPDGQWWLLIHPDGNVEPTTAPNTTHDTVQGAAQPKLENGVTATQGGTHNQHEPTPRHAAPAQSNSRPSSPNTPPRVRSAAAPTAQIPEPAAGRAPAANPGTPTAAAAPSAPNRPTANDLRASQPAPQAAPATWGWRGQLNRTSAGLLRLAPGVAELAHRAAIATVQKNLTGPKTIVIANPKGGAAKTPTVALLAATFGQQRGGYTLAWDNNESHGTLGDRSLPTRHANTALDLLHDLDSFRNSSAARVGDLDNYVRLQGDGQYDVLASNGDIERNTEITAEAYRDLHATLARFYRVMFIDTGNNPIASGWTAAIASADLLVIPATPRDDRIRVAAELVDRLRAQGFDQLVDNAVFLLSNHSPSAENTALTADARRRAIDHFSRHVRRVVEVPFDPAIDAGGPIQIGQLSTSSREAWLQAAAAVAEGLGDRRS